MSKLILLAAALIFLLSCSVDETTGTLTLKLTDAPVAFDSLEAVYITFDEISANISGTGEEGWQSLAVFEEGLTVDLKSLTDGMATILAKNIELPAGQVNQIRFMLDAPAEGEPLGNPGCFLRFTNGVTVPLYIPSGENSGFKAVNSFTVPVNGEVTVTADFDARKSLVRSGGKFRLRPTIRLIVDNQAGRINGTVTLTDIYSEYSIYAYENDTYNTKETEQDRDGIQFPGAVSSTTVKEDFSYVLAYLMEGTYDLVVAGNRGDGSDLTVIDTEENVPVEAEKTTHRDIDTTD